LSPIHQRETILVDGNPRPNRLKFSSLGTLDVFPPADGKAIIPVTCVYPKALDFIHERTLKHAVKFGDEHFRQSRTRKTPHFPLFAMVRVLVGKRWS
jgi:hypothetical protein